MSVLNNSTYTRGPVYCEVSVSLQSSPEEARIHSALLISLNTSLLSSGVQKMKREIGASIEHALAPVSQLIIGD
jgi:hypothetical protein